MLKTLNRPDVKDDLRSLHKRFVFVPTDKASNNISIICKKFYLDTLLKEASYDINFSDGIQDTENQTYLMVNSSDDSIIQRLY